MKDPADVKIALVGAAGMSFGPIMTLDAVRTKKIRGATLVMMDVNEKNLDNCFAAGTRLNEAAGNPIRIEKETDIARALDGASFVLMSVENDRWKYWKQDYEIPRRYGSSQIMGENGGPGGLFHSLRSVGLTQSICRDIEKYAPDAFLINLTNPMSRVCLAINRYTKLKNVGLCHEITGGLLRVAAATLTPMEKIHGEASGINHFTFFYKIENKETGEDLYPKMKRHVKMFPFLYGQIVRHMLEKHDHFATTSDSHLSEYLPEPNRIHTSSFPYHAFFHNEWKLRNTLTTAYGKGYFPIPLDMLPPSGEAAFPIIEAMATGERDWISAVNVPNNGNIPNLPQDAMIECSAWADGDGLAPEVIPPIEDGLAELMRRQIEVQSMVVDAAHNGDRDLAYQALLADPQCPPSESNARKMFDTMCRLQSQYLPF